MPRYILTIEDQGDGWRGADPTIVAVASSDPVLVDGFAGEYYVAHLEAPIEDARFGRFEAAMVKRAPELDAGKARWSLPVYLLRHFPDDPNSVLGDRSFAGFKARVTLDVE